MSPRCRKLFGVVIFSFIVFLLKGSSCLHPNKHNLSCSVTRQTTRTDMFLSVSITSPSRVTLMSSSHVCSSDAYVLFYELTSSSRMWSLLEDGRPQHRAEWWTDRWKKCCDDAGKVSFTQHTHTCTQEPWPPAWRLHRELEGRTLKKQQEPDQTALCSSPSLVLLLKFVCVWTHVCVLGCHRAIIVPCDRLVALSLNIFSMHCKTKLLSWMRLLVSIFFASKHQNWWVVFNLCVWGFFCNEVIMVTSDTLCSRGADSPPACFFFTAVPRTFSQVMSVWKWSEASGTVACSRGKPSNMF